MIIILWNMDTRLKNSVEILRKYKNRSIDTKLHDAPLTKIDIKIKTSFNYASKISRRKSLHDFLYIFPFITNKRTSGKLG